MKLSLANTPYILRETGLPIEGRLKVYLHESDTYANLYTLEGSSYTVAQNPQLLHAGLPEASLFTDTGVYDLVIEQYIGLPGFMSVESPDSDFAKVDEFQWGLDFNPSAYTISRVDTIAEMRQADPSVGMVNVLWYSAPGDCSARYYVWDANAVNEEDGGYVIMSDLSDSGRWILMWDDEVIPASVYGVKPGDESNINLLLNYPETVGSFGLKTAPCVRFLDGTYTSAVDFTTSKELVFDSDAQFLSSTFSCPKVSVLGKVTGYIADFILTSPDAEAHSSWFRTITRFWTCGAKYLYLDSTNYFTNSQVTRNVTIQDKVIFGSHRLEATYAYNTCITVNRCDIGGKIFSPAYDYVRLATDRGDAMFVSTGTWDPGLISAGHHIQYDNAPELELFDSVERWYSTINERKGRLGSTMSQTVLDFCGRSCSSNVNTTNWQGIRNLVATGGVYVTNSCSLDTVSGNVAVHGSNVDLSINNCTITFSNSPVGLGSLTSLDSDITVSGNLGIDPTDTALYIRGGSWAGIVKMSDAHANAYAMHKYVSFTDVFFPVQFKWRVNVVSLVGCNGQLSVDMIPYANGDKFSYSADFTGNTFLGSSRIWFTIFCNADNQHGELAGKVNFNGVRIVGNRFNGSDQYGIKMLRWHPYAITPLMNSDTGSSEYHDNTGACPRNTPGILANTDKWTGEHMALTVKWRTYADVYNIWAPYVVSNDGSISYVKDMTGLVPAPEGAMIAFVITALGDMSGTNIVSTGYQSGVDFPSTAEDFFDEDKNNMLIVRPCVTVGMPACPTFNSGYTFWYKPSVV